MVGADPFDPTDHRASGRVHVHLGPVATQRPKGRTQPQTTLYDAGRRADVGRDADQGVDTGERDERLPGAWLAHEQPVGPHLEELSCDDGVALPRQVADVHAHLLPEGCAKAVSEPHRCALGPHELPALRARLAVPGGRQLGLQVCEELVPAHDENRRTKCRGSDADLAARPPAPRPLPACG